MEKIYSSREEEGILIVTLLQSEVSMEDNERLRNELYDLVEKNGKNVLMNLSKIAFISSMLLSTLVVLLKKARDLGRDMYLCSMQDSVQQVLKITGIDKLFTAFDSEEAAFSILKSKK